MKRTYLRFCLHFSRTPVPASSDTIVLYTVFLARSLSPSSLSGYLNIVKQMHLEQGCPDPLDCYGLRAVKKGIHRQLGRPPKQKLPITPELLRKMHLHLDLQKSMDRAFWAACLVAFYAFLRKSTLLPKSGSTKDATKALCVKDISIQTDGTMLTLHVRHTKTIQFGQRNLVIPIAAVANSTLCPVKAVTNMLLDLRAVSLQGDQPLFSFMLPQGAIGFLTFTLFVKKLQNTLI